MKQSYFLASASRYLVAGLLLGPFLTNISAHPNHHFQLIVPANEPTHWWADPEHAMLWLIALGAGCAARSILRKRLACSRS